MKKNLKLYVPVLNIAGIWLTLWLLTITNVKPVAPTTAHNQADTIRTTITSSKYVYGLQVSNQSFRKNTKLLANF